MSKAATDTTCRCGCGGTEGIIRHSGRGKTAGFIAGHSPKEREAGSSEAVQAAREAAEKATVELAEGSIAPALRAFPPTPTEPTSDEKVIEQARTDRAAGVTLAELKGRYPGFDRSWVEGVTPQRTAAKAKENGQSKSARYRTLAPFVKRARALGGSDATHVRLGERYEMSDMTAWRICHAKAYADIAAAGPEESEPDLASL